GDGQYLTAEPHLQWFFHHEGVHAVTRHGTADPPHPYPGGDPPHTHSSRSSHRWDGPKTTSSPCAELPQRAPASTEEKNAAAHYGYSGGEHVRPCGTNGTWSGTGPPEQWSAGQQPACCWGRPPASRGIPGRNRRPGQGSDPGPHRRASRTARHS